MKRFWSAPFLLAILTVFSVSSPQSSEAANNIWTNQGDGSWEVATNWSIGTPSNTDSILITNNGNYTVSIDNTTANTGSTATWMQVSSLAVGASVGQPTLMIDFTNTARMLNLSSAGTGALNLGNASGRNGKVVLANGQFNVNAIASGAIINSQIGNTGQGTFIMSNGTFVSPFVDVGSAAGGIGEYDIYGGTATHSIALLLGRVLASTGTVTVGGGQLNVTASTTYVGYDGLGIMNVNGGALNVNAITFGANLTGRGQLNLNGGVVNSTTVAIGDKSQGTMTMSNGILNTSSVGSFTVGNVAGASGQVSIYGGTNNLLKTSSGALIIGNSAGSTGSVLLAGGLLNANSVTNGGFVNTEIGLSGRGTFTVSNGTFNSPFVDVGSGAGGVGDWNIYGGTNNVVLDLFVARNSSNTGSILVGGGLFNSSGNTVIGYQGQGSLTVSNGTANLGTAYVADFSGATGKGQLNVYGGIGSASGALAVGSQNGTVGS